MMVDATPVAPLSPRATAVARRIDSAVLWFTTHWLAVFIAYGATVVGFAMLAPLLRANDHGLATKLIYLPYRFICHQHADRSFHLHGEQVAFCQRDTAIVSAAVAVGIGFALFRRWRGLPTIPFRVVVLFALPMAIDGTSQLVGLRESTALLRVITGSLFSIGVGWFVLPHLERGFATIRDDIRQRRMHSQTGVPTSA